MPKIKKRWGGKIRRRTGKIGRGQAIQGFRGGGVKKLGVEKAWRPLSHRCLACGGVEQEDSKKKRKKTPGKFQKVAAEK